MSGLLVAAGAWCAGMGVIVAGVAILEWLDATLTGKNGETS